MTFLPVKLVQVESLFHNYQQRRNSRVSVPQDNERKVVMQPHCKSGLLSTPQSESTSRSASHSAPTSDVK